MAQIECGRGHLYDPEVHPTCPYCSNNQRITVAAAGRTAPVSVTAPSRTAPVSVTGEQKTAPLSVAAQQRTAPIPVTAAQKTMPPKGYGMSVTADNRTMPPKGYGVSVTEPQKTMPPRGYGEPAPAPRPESPPAGYGMSVTASNKTVGMMQEKMGFDPVVGWLACVEGPGRGKSYTIHGGVNAIGRSERMDITITGDMTISSENHAKISYSDRSNRFNLIPGDGRNIVYLNDEEIFAPTPLSAYDVIDFGETKLLFVPLCGDRFVWEKKGEA